MKVIKLLLNDNLYMYIIVYIKNDNFYCILLLFSADLVIAVMGDKPPLEASFKVIIIIIISFTITSMYIWPTLILILCYY